MEEEEEDVFGSVSSFLQLQQGEAGQVFWE